MVRKLAERNTKTITIEILNAYSGYIIIAEKQEISPMCDRLQNLPISVEHDLIYDVIS